MAKLITLTILLTGALISAIGLILIVMYFKDAIFMRSGESDLSLIFWYLTFLFVGIGSLLCGVVVGQAGLRRLKPANGISNLDKNPVKRPEDNHE